MRKRAVMYGRKEEREWGVEESVVKGEPCQTGSRREQKKVLPAPHLDGKINVEKNLVKSTERIDGKGGREGRG